MKWSRKGKGQSINRSLARPRKGRATAVGDGDRAQAATARRMTSLLIADGTTKGPRTVLSVAVGIAVAVAVCRKVQVNAAASRDERSGRSLLAWY